MGLILGSISAVNYTVDVSGVYRVEKGFVENYVDRLSQSSFGLVMPQTSERKIKYELVRRTTADCYVTGSSHEMAITRDDVPPPNCGSLLNLAASGGGYEDALIMMNAVADRKGATVIIGMGPWFFKPNADSRWQELTDVYTLARATFFGSTARHLSTKKWENLVNGEYFIRNITRFRSFKRPSEEVKEVAGDDDAVFRSDGSLIYSKGYVRSTFPRSDVTVCSEYKVDTPFVHGHIVNEMERAVSHLQKNGLKVIFLMMPYHPGVFRCSNRTVAAMEAAERAARELAATLGVSVWGGYDSRNLGLTGQDFYDFMHIDADSLKKISLKAR